ncbi:MAG: PTS transporter subunit IIC [Bacilli bacterium]|jgi:uncharacterized membrane protein
MEPKVPAEEKDFVEPVASNSHEKKKDKKTAFKELMKRFLAYLIKTSNGMAKGLFATLIIGVIIGQIGTLLNYNFYFLSREWNIGGALIALSGVLKGLMGVGIAVGVGISLEKKGLHLISLAMVGGIASNAALLGFSNDPLVIYVVVTITSTLVDLILKKETPVDIIIIPLIHAVFAGILTFILDFPIHYITVIVGQFLNTATTYQPFLMGIVIAVIMGMALTAPISSAAIAIAFGISGLAGGAAVVGCCVQMLGFAIQGRKDNPIGVTISTGIGTSMLQFKNILKKPIIWLPTIIASAILGPLATTIFQLKCNKEGAGMGTSGLVGLFGTFAEMGTNLHAVIAVLVLEIILPIVLVFVIDLIFRKAKLYQKGDFTI